MKTVITLARRVLSSAASFVPSHVSWKIVAPYIVLTLLVAAVGTFIATQFATGPLEERFNNQLAEAARSGSHTILDSTVFPNAWTRSSRARRSRR